MKRRKQENEENKKKKTMSDREREIERERESYVNSLTVCIHFSIYYWMARREQVTVFLKQWSPMWCFVSAATANTILHIYTKCLASMLIIDDRTRVSDLLECVHTLYGVLRYSVQRCAQNRSIKISHWI